MNAEVRTPRKQYGKFSHEYRSRTRRASRGGCAGAAADDVKEVRSICCRSLQRIMISAHRGTATEQAGGAAAARRARRQGQPALRLQP